MKAYWEGYGLTIKVYNKVECVFCNACNKLVASDDLGAVRQHCFKKTSTTAQAAFDALPDAKKKGNHWEKLVVLRLATEKLEEMTKLRHANAATLFAKTGKTPPGSTLSDPVIASRVEVGLSLWTNGIPVTKLESPEFCDLIERPHEDLGGLNGVKLQLPLVLDHVKEKRNAAVKEKWVVVYFDGSKVNEMIELCVGRYLDDDFDVVQIVLGAKMVGTSLAATGLEALLMDQIRDAGIPIARVVATVSDSAAVNPASIKHHNQVAGMFRFGAELDEHMLEWLGCLAHAYSNCGTILRKEFPLLKLFMKGFKRMTNTSDAACQIWREQCGEGCPGLTENRWWAFYDSMVCISRVWSKIPQFLKEAKARGVCEKNIQRMDSAFTDRANRSILRAQLDVVLGYGKSFRDACLLMETDGFTLPFVKRTLKQQKGICDRFLKHRGDDIIIATAMIAVAEAQLGEQIEGTRHELVRAVLKVCTQFTRSIWEGFSEKFLLFNAAALFNPTDYISVYPDQSKLLPLLTFLASMKGLNGGKTLASELAAEASLMMDLSKEHATVLQQHPAYDTPDGLLLWWKSIQLRVPAFFSVFKILVLIQPSSAVVERFFSVIKGGTSKQQNREYPETFEGRVLALCNGK